MSHPATGPATVRPGTALITGPTAGIGRCFADAFAGRGHDLVLVARDTARLENVATELRTTFGVAVEVISADLADRAQLATVEDRLTDPARPVQVLVNNAGFGLKHSFLDNPIEREQAQCDVLVTAVLRLSHAALLGMVERGDGQIVNVSSVAGFFPRGTYSAAKAYVTQFSEWAHNEYAARGVTVMALCPGFVRTEFHSRMQVDINSAPRLMWLRADKLVAEAMVDLDAKKAISIPSRRYRALVRASKVVPTGSLQKLQSFGRK